VLGDTVIFVREAFALFGIVQVTSDSDPQAPLYNAKPNCLFDVPSILICVVVAPVVNVNYPSL
jgi:hypothetical protein